MHERLLKQKEERLAEMKLEGESAGRKWATEVADYSDLEALKAWYNSVGNALSDDETTKEHIEKETAVSVFDEDLDLPAVSSSAEWFRGYVEAACEVFDEVENEAIRA